ncbi:MAG: hypothetical protein J5J06_00800 [Phycisphaerae bacterium]|nr:hypothetical protein [Phycisphaerae bacterium]
MSADIPMEARSHERTTAEVLAGESLGEGLAAAGALVVAIIGLAGLYPLPLAAIATIAVGGALLLEGGTIAARYRSILTETGGGTFQASELGGGLSSEILGGAAGIVLGILALLGVGSIMLIAVATIVLGGAVLVGSVSDVKLNSVTIHGTQMSEQARALARSGVSAAATAQALVGAGAIVLGILALLNNYPMVLTLTAMLSLGGTLLLASSAIGSRFLALLSRS